jgi:hypothetical protein
MVNLCNFLKRGGESVMKESVKFVKITKPGMNVKTQIKAGTALTGKSPLAAAFRGD